MFESVFYAYFAAVLVLGFLATFVDDDDYRVL